MRQDIDITMQVSTKEFAALVRKCEAVLQTNDNNCYGCILRDVCGDVGIENAKGIKLVILNE